MIFRGFPWLVALALLWSVPLAAHLTPATNGPVEEAYYRTHPSFPSVKDVLPLPDYLYWGDEPKFRGQVDYLRRLLALPPLDRLFGRQLPSPQGVFLASENGRYPIQAIRLNVFRKDVPFAALISDYGRAMQAVDGFELWIVSAPQMAPDVARAVAELSPGVRRRVRELPLTFGIGSIWPKDGSRTGFGSVFLDTATDSGDFAFPTGSLLSAGLVSRIPSAFHIAGGDAPLGDQFSAVGPVVVQDAMQRLGVSRSAAIEAISAELGRQAIEVHFPVDSNEPKPLTFHTDLAMTFAVDMATGEEVAVVQSPRALLEEVLRISNLDELMRTKPQEWQTHLGLAMQALLMETTTNPESFSATENELELLASLWDLHPLDLYTRVLAFDLAAKRMSEQTGRRVVLVPGWFVESIGPTEEQIFNYTNVVLTPGHAFVGHLDVSWLDRAADEVYRSLGYTVHPFPSMAGYMKKQGLLSCASEVFRSVTMD